MNRWIVLSAITDGSARQTISLITQPLLNRADAE